jgi:hypothetical protein
MSALGGSIGEGATQRGSAPARASARRAALSPAASSLAARSRPRAGGDRPQGSGGDRQGREHFVNTGYAGIVKSEKTRGMGYDEHGQVEREGTGRRGGSGSSLIAPRARF